MTPAPKPKLGTLLSVGVGLEVSTFDCVATELVELERAGLAGRWVRVAAGE